MKSANCTITSVSNTFSDPRKRKGPKNREILLKFQGKNYCVEWKNQQKY